MRGVEDENEKSSLENSFFFSFRRQVIQDHFENESCNLKTFFFMNLSHAAVIKVAGAEEACSTCRSFSQAHCSQLYVYFKRPVFVL